MPRAVSPTIILCVVAYLGICLLIGIWAMRRTHNSADFFLAAKALGPVVVILATISSVMSGFGFIGGPGLVFDSGSSSFWIVFASGFGMAFAVTMVGKRLRLLAETGDVLTLPDAVAARYGGRWPRAAMAVAILLGVLGYLGTQVMAVGLVLVAVLDISMPVALLLGLGVLAFYSVAGGMIASVYTDLFQGLLMLGAAAAVFYYALAAGGGLASMTQTLWVMDPEFLGPWGTRGPLTALSWFLLFAVGAVGQPHSITKFMMIRDARNLRWVGLLAGPSYAVLALLWVSIGVVMRALVERGVEPALATADLAAPMFLLHHTPQLLAGLVFAGLLAAVMSTADSFLNIGAAAAVRDLPIAFRGRPLQRELLWSRLATGVLLAASALFAMHMENLVALLGTFGWGTFAAAIVPSVAIGMNWKRATAAACVASITVSIVLNFALELAARYGWYTLPYGMNVGCLSMLVSLCVFVGVSWLSSTPAEERIPPQVRAAMEL
jgi:SSS family transporter